MVKNQRQWDLRGGCQFRALLRWGLIHKYDSTIKNLESEMLRREASDRSRLVISDQTIGQLAAGFGNAKREPPRPNVRQRRWAITSVEALDGMLPIPGYPTLHYSGNELIAICQGLIRVPFDPREEKSLLREILTTDEEWEERFPDSEQIEPYQEPPFTVLIREACRVATDSKLSSIEDIAKVMSEGVKGIDYHRALHLLLTGAYEAITIRISEFLAIYHWYINLFPGTEKEERENKLVMSVDPSTPKSLSGIGASKGS